MHNCIPMEHGKIKIQTLTHGNQDCLVPDVFKTSCLSLSKILKMFLRLTCYHDDLLILTNRTFKDHLHKLEMVLARLSTAGLRVSISKSKFFAEHIEYLVPGYWITRQNIQPIRNKVEMNAIRNIKAPKIRNAQLTTPVHWYSQLLLQHVLLQK
jgi:hypothetical protein